MSAPPSLAAQLITISVLSLQRQISHYNLASRSTWNSTYDFVVVGAGGAGAIVASRLSENPAVSVLLLEAGGPETAATDIPANYYEWVGNPHTDWNYPMAPQPQLGQAFTMPAHMSVGRILGGSTTISGMVYNRGNRRNFDEWDYHYGCRGWNYNNTLQYFIVSENQTDPNYLNGSSAMYHGTSGPIAVSSDWSRLNTMPVYGDYLRTAQMAGYPLIDVNADSQNGVTLFQHTIQDGSKVTSSSAYLAPNKNRTNLHIVSHAYVTGVQFNGNTAHSVSFTRTGRDYTVRANREIILSAGTIGSAQLLLLSGVGPRAHLSSLGIPVVTDLPVGNNLHDHTNTILYFDIPDQSLAYQPIDLNAQNLYNLYVNHNGPLVMFPNAATYIVSRQNNVTAWPDVMTEMVRSNNHWKNLTYLASMYQDQESWADYWRLYSGRRLLSFDVQMVRPRARGTLRLASANPNTMPIIDPNYFGDPRDIDAMVDGIRTVLNRITSQGPFAQSARFISQPVPGCQLCDNEPYCEQYIRCFIRQTSVAVFRHAGTCRCGASTDPNAVVDERLRVLNVQRLRVVDGSIMPQIINANSWPATAMIAEYASAMIRVDNNI